MDDLRERVTRLEEQSKTIFGRLGRIEMLQWAMLTSVIGGLFVIVLKVTT
ncbi:MAG: hypothetical protein V3W41_22395 [Planctomycetota bacterium]